MALNDNPKPLTTYEFQAVGNRVIGGGTDRYIAGLVHVSQQDLNGGAGYINFIDYSTGDFEIGGQLGVRGTGSRVRINDPVADGTEIANTGRYTRGAPSPDGRFQVDPDNPTIMSATGYPMCIPRVQPLVFGGAGDDPLCPQTNRPFSNGLKDPITGQQHPPAGEFDSFFTTNLPGAPTLDPNKQAPMEIGDFVNTAGSVETDGSGTYISAHTVVNNTAIYTQPGVDPAYVMTEVALIGTGGLTVFGAGEAVVRTRFEGMTTDPSRNIRLYGIDINPATGATADRDWGSIGVDPGPPNGAVKGRWRFRPPCTVTVATDKKCVGPAAGSFLPPTREVRAVIDGKQQFNADGTTNTASQVPGTPSAVPAANGIFWGQYHAPIGEYIFPENVPGQPIPENTFNSLDFLAYGGYASFTGVQAGVLNPWPSNVPAPARVCPTPAILGGPYNVAFGGTVNLAGSVNANASTPLQLFWTAGTAPGLTDLNGALTNANTSTPTFSAVGLAPGAVANVTFTASNICGPVAVSTTVTVAAAPKPTVNAIAAQTVTLGAPPTPVNIVASSNTVPAATSFTFTQTGGPAVVPVVTAVAPVPPATASARATFTPAVAGVYTFNVTATNVNGTGSPVPATVTVNAVAPNINIVVAPAEYRIGKQRLVLTATTADLTVTSMILQPYKLDNGTTFNPASLGATFTNGGGGVWTLTVVGAPPPACRNNPAQYVTPCTQAPLLVTSTGGAAGPGTSAQTALDRIRN
jgi:hypothetical protein